MGGKVNGSAAATEEPSGQKLLWGGQLLQAEPDSQGRFAGSAGCSRPHLRIVNNELTFPLPQSGRCKSGGTSSTKKVFGKYNRGNRGIV